MVVCMNVTDPNQLQLGNSPARHTDASVSTHPADCRHRDGVPAGESGLSRQHSLAGGVKAESPDHLAVGVLPAVEHHASTLKQVDVDARDVAVLAGHGRTGAEQSDLTLIPWDVLP